MLPDFTKIPFLAFLSLTFRIIIMLKICIALFVGLISTSTFAAPPVEITGRVVFLEASYMPGLALFTMDNGIGGNCYAGAPIRYQKTDESNKIAYSTLMAAALSGKRIRVYVDVTDPLCPAIGLHLLVN
jgi:hypothetical protein